jgi:DNA mismatch endonuclease (patch repair protein)
MRSNVSSGTKPELLLSRLLRKKISKSDLPGSPDFVFPRKRLVVFVHGCFWHRCPKCDFALPKRNRSFWAAKFERNVARDRLANRELKRMGWKVIEVWEHELRRNPMRVKQRILRQ